MLVYPPGYLLYMKHAMAVMLAPDYGREVAQAIRDTLNVAKGNISRANIPRRYARFDSALLGNGGGANWQRGY
jgi:predicted GTPase